MTDYRERKLHFYNNLLSIRARDSRCWLETRVRSVKTYKLCYVLRVGKNAKIM